RGESLDQRRHVRRVAGAAGIRDRNSAPRRPHVHAVLKHPPAKPAACPGVISRKVSCLRGGRAVDNLLADLRFAARMLLKRPGFTLVAVLSLALGIGANSTIFSLVNAMLLRAPAVADPGSVVALYTRDAKNADTPLALMPTSHLNWKDTREQAR